MPRILDKFNKVKNPYAQANGVNHEDFPTFQRSQEEAYLQLLLTNTLGGTFYASEDSLFAGTLEQHAEMAKYDPAFMARALVYARNEGLMRMQPIVGLAYLAKANHDLFHQIFSRIIQTPGDLTDFVEIVRGEIIPGGMGRTIKRAVNGWLNGISEYHAIKYAAGGQGYSLRDILRVSHPKPMSDLQDAIFMYLTDQEKWAAAGKGTLTPQIQAFESIKHLDMNADPNTVRQMIEDGKLPYEIVTGVIKPDVETWRTLMRQMPYMALLRHLNTFQRAGVLHDEDNARYVAERLSDSKAITKAKVLPFRLFTAYQMFAPEHPAERMVSEALVTAMDAAFVNMPALGGPICLATDVSGSMGGQISRDSKTTYVDIAGVFTGALVKKTKQVIAMPFDTGIKTVKVSQQDSIMTTAEKIRQLVGGGTAISTPISELLAKKIKVEVFIGITDQEEWATDHRGGIGFLPQWQEYKRTVSPKAKAFLITIAPYRHAVAPQDTPDLYFIYGWNDFVLKYISLSINGLAGQVESVRNMEL